LSADLDWHSTKQHCARLLDGRAWDTGGLATLITTHHDGVGSAIKLGEQHSEAIGLGSILVLQRFPNEPCVHAVSWWLLLFVATTENKQFYSIQISDFVLSHFHGDDREGVAAALAPNARTGLFVNERLLNVPPLLALPLHESIYEELQTAKQLQQQQQLIGNHRAWYDLDYVMFITVAYRDSRGESGAPPVQRKKARDSQSQVEWFHPEEAV
jgi:hypothetical protein